MGSLNPGVPGQDPEGGGGSRMSWGDQQVLGGDYRLERTDGYCREVAVVLGWCCSQELEQLTVTRVSENDLVAVEEQN